MPSPSPRAQANPQESYSEGLAALQAGDNKKAEKKFGEVLSAAPKHPQANYYMGIAKKRLGKTKAAVKYFENAIDADAGFTEAREQLALVSIELGNASEANAQLVKLKEQQAQCKTVDCGEAYTKRLDEAVAKVEKALAPAAATDTPPDAASPESGSGATVSGSGALPMGLLFFDTAADGFDRYQGAVRLINEAHYEDAIKTLYEAQAIVGPHPDILNYLGYAHRKLGKFDKAEDYYHQALALDPGHLGANEYLGELYLAKLDELCPFGCADREDLARLIAIKDTTRSAAQE
jgi:tetratricopeptide (TPR) repeat protein